MVMSEKIARMLEEMLEQQNGMVEIRRNDFAGQMGCVPSQINYVLSSRFNRQHGYIVESRRGGGGYIKITRVRVDKNAYLMHLFASVGEELDLPTARAHLSFMEQNGMLEPEKHRIFAALLSDAALAAEKEPQIRNRLRADLFKTMILSLVQ